MAADFAVAADLLYSEELARGVARALAKLHGRGARCIASDSQYHHRAAFINELASCLGRDEADLLCV